MANLNVSGVFRLFQKTKSVGCLFKNKAVVQRHFHNYCRQILTQTRVRFHSSLHNLKHRGPRLCKVSYRNFNDNPQQQVQFREKLQIATYISCGIGVVMLSAVGWKEYQKFTRKARGADAIKDREVSGQKVISYKYRGYVIPAFMVDKLDSLHSFEVRESDVWIVSFPKAGTTWLQEIVYLISTDFDYDKAEKKIIEERFPYLEFVNPGLKAISEMESPRFIKSHLPPSLLPRQIKEKKPKMIYICRNPKDTLVSYYFFTKSLALITYFGDLDIFFNQFVNDTVIYGPWWKHVKEGWNLKNQENVLFLKYEDLQKDLRGCIEQIAEFLGKSVDRDQMDRLVQHTSFESMKRNSSVNYSWWNGWAVREGQEGQFLRKGKVGDWRNHLSPEMSVKIDELVSEKLEGTGLEFEDVPRQ